MIFVNYFQLMNCRNPRCLALCEHKLTLHGGKEAAYSCPRCGWLRDCPQHHYVVAARAPRMSIHEVMVIEARVDKAVEAAQQRARAEREHAAAASAEERVATLEREVRRLRSQLNERRA